MNTKESSARTMLTILFWAQQEFDQAYHSGYADHLELLGSVAGRKPQLESAALVDRLLAGRANAGSSLAFSKNGYSFVYRPGPPDEAGRITSHTISARPGIHAPGSRRSFLIDELGLLRETDENRAVTADDEGHSVAWSPAASDEHGACAATVAK